MESLTIRLVRKEDEEELQVLLKEQLFDVPSYAWALLNQPKCHLAWAAGGLLCGFALNSVLSGIMSLLAMPILAFVLLYFTFKREQKGNFKDIHKGCYEYWTTEGRALWVAVHDGHVVGSTAITRKPDNTAEVQRVVTDVQARGRGIARRLLRLVEEEAKGMGISALTLHTSHPLKGAIALYTSEGFVRISKRTVFYGIITIFGFKKEL